MSTFSTRIHHVQRIFDERIARLANPIPHQLQEPASTGMSRAGNREGSNGG